MKKGFSLIELIFAIVIIGIIATVGIPKLLSLNTKASVSTISQDANSILSSVQSYYIVNKKIDKITDAISLNSSVWNIEDKTVKYMENGKECINITVVNDTVVLTIDANAGSICKELKAKGINNTTLPLN